MFVKKKKIIITRAFARYSFNEPPSKVVPAANRNKYTLFAFTRRLEHDTLCSTLNLYNTFHCDDLY